MRYEDVLPQKNGVVVSCSASDIFEVNQTKEYTASATFLLEHVLMDKHLGQAAKLWQLLFSKARFDSELSIQISNTYLESVLQKSVRQIQRYIDKLVTHGYLQVKFNFRQGKGQVTNTYYVRFPLDALEAGKQSKDRRVGDNDESYSLYFDELNEWDSMNNYLPIPGEKKSIADEFKLSTHSEKSLQVTNQRASFTPPCDKNVVHNNKSSTVVKKEENNRKENVVKSFLITEPPLNKSSTYSDESMALEAKELSEIDLLKLEIERNESVIKAAQDKLIKAREDAKKFEFGSVERHDFEKASVWPLDTVIEVSKLRINTLQKKLTLLEQVKSTMLPIQNNSHFIALLPGNRKIQPTDLYYLKEQLSNIPSLKNRDKVLAKVVNEICFAARFGSLQKTPYNEPIRIRHAFNIGVKLVREGRWVTPSGMEAYIKQKALH